MVFSELPDILLINSQVLKILGAGTNGRRTAQLLVRASTRKKYNTRIILL